MVFMMERVRRQFWISTGVILDYLITGVLPINLSVSFFVTLGFIPNSDSYNKACLVELSIERTYEESVA
jgi:hypothetical protein